MRVNDIVVVNVPTEGILSRSSEIKSIANGRRARIVAIDPLNSSKAVLRFEEDFLHASILTGYWYHVSELIIQNPTPHDVISIYKQKVKISGVVKI